MYSHIHLPLQPVASFWVYFPVGGTSTPLFYFFAFVLRARLKAGIYVVFVISFSRSPRLLLLYPLLRLLVNPFPILSSLCSCNYNVISALFAITSKSDHAQPLTFFFFLCSLFSLFRRRLLLYACTPIPFSSPAFGASKPFLISFFASIAHVLNPALSVITFFE